MKLRNELMSPRCLGLACMLLAFSGDVALAQDPAVSRRPNILFLMADELRADTLGFAGHRQVATPNLDRLAAQSIRFAAAYTPSPVCGPARAAILTGRYPQANGARRNEEPIRADEQTLPEILRQHGYTTGMAGKLHLEREHFGRSLLGWISLQTAWRFRSGFFEHEWLTRQGYNWEYQRFLDEHGMPGIGERSFLASTKIDSGSPELLIATSALPARLHEEVWIADRAIEFLQQRRESPEPWLLFVSMVKPHSPYLLPHPYAELYEAQKMGVPATFRAGTPDSPPDSSLYWIFDKAVLQELVAHYYGAVTMMDVEMGRVLASLSELNLDDDTIVVFTSDHGNMLGERNLIFKDVMYEGSAKVPLLMRVPERYARGPLAKPGRIASPMDLTALLPTLLELADVPIPADVQGRSVLESVETAGEPMAFSVLNDQMIVWRNFKLIVPLEERAGAQARRKPELYDLERDPLEQNDLYESPAHRRVRRQLKQALEGWWRRTANSGAPASEELGVHSEPTASRVALR